MLKEDRRFHDSWAFFLMLILGFTLISLSTIMALQGGGPTGQRELDRTYDFEHDTFEGNQGTTYTYTRRKSYDGYELEETESGVDFKPVRQNYKKAYKIVGAGMVVAIATVTVFLPIFLVFLKHFPKGLIYGALIVPPLLLFVCAFISVYTYGLIFAALVEGLFSLVMYILIRNSIDFSALILSHTADILTPYSLYIAFISFGFVAICALHCILMSLLSFKGVAAGVLSTLQTLQLFWVYNFALYFFCVLVCSIVFLRLEKRTSGVLGSAFRIALYASGSIALGALISAAVATLRSLVDSMGNRDNRDRERGRDSIFFVILVVILSVILSFLQVVVDEINRMTFPYLAMTGESFVSSIKGSFSQLTSRSISRNLGLWSISSRIGGLFFISLFGVQLFADFLVVLLFLGVSEILRMENILAIIATIVLQSLAPALIASALDSSVLAMLYASIFEPDIVRDLDNQVVEVVEEEIKKNR